MISSYNIITLIWNEQVGFRIKPLLLPSMVQIDLLAKLSLQIKSGNNTRLVFDVVRKKWITFTPEEHVRQAIVHYLLYQMNYPAGLIAIEKQIKFGTLNKRFDIVVYDPLHTPWMLIECKAPQIAVSENTLYQLLQYQSIVQCKYWLLSNGVETICADANNIHEINWLHELPEFPSQ